MSNQFTDVIYNNIPRNSFNLSHSKKFSMNMGQLVPFLTQEVVPGDSFRMSQEQMVRMAPMVAPVMDKVTVDTHFFFVPNRLLWAGWEEFITNPTDPLNPAPFVKPYNFADPITIQTGSIMDYLGYPTGAVPQTAKLNALPLAAYNRIYNEYYRDQNLQNSSSDIKAEELTDGNNNLTNDAFFKMGQAKPYRRAWGKDYFTSALPFPQKGNPVTLGLGGTAPILFTPDNPIPTGETDRYKKTGLTNPVDGAASFLTGSLKDSAGNIISVDNSKNLSADLTAATAVTINDLRTATKLQEWLEINARSGTRYIESIKAHYGVTSRDARLQRPEFLGGGSSNIAFSEVLQQSASDEVTPQGNMSGHGINVGNSRTINYRAEEHGFIIGIISVKPVTSYMNITPKWALRLDPLDYLFPLFAQLGEQPVYNCEVKGDYAAADREEIFGYQSKYAEYKNTPSTVHGDFKGNLDFWHMARKFETDPILNAEFVKSNPDPRIFAVTEEQTDKLYVMLYNNIQAVRPLPRYNIPQLG
ncbi:MAG: major capsid protein [Microviridae sp.]|nr:MAG: major capsid protein [Microviridae sp.]